MPCASFKKIGFNDLLLFMQWLTTLSQKHKSFLKLFLSYLDVPGILMRGRLTVQHSSGHFYIWLQTEAKPDMIFSI